MAYVILRIEGVTARDLQSWDWDSIIEPDTGSVEVNAFDTAEELEAAIAAKAAR